MAVPLNIAQYLLLDEIPSPSKASAGLVSGDDSGYFMEGGLGRLNLRRIRHRLRKSLAQRGVIATARLLLQKGLRPPSKIYRTAPKEYASVHPFDLQFGVETSGLLFAEDLSSGSRKDLFNTGLLWGIPFRVSAGSPTAPAGLRKIHLCRSGFGQRARSVDRL